MADIIYGQTDEMSNTSNKLLTFSSDLDGHLTTIRDSVNTIVEATKGVASTTLFDSYQDLDAKLKTYVEELEVYGNSLQSKADDFDEVDRLAASSAPTFTMG